MEIRIYKYFFLYLQENSINSLALCFTSSVIHTTFCKGIFRGHCFAAPQVPYSFLASFCFFHTLSRWDRTHRWAWFPASGHWTCRMPTSDLRLSAATFHNHLQLQPAKAWHLLCAFLWLSILAFWAGIRFLGTDKRFWQGTRLIFIPCNNLQLR